MFRYLNVLAIASLVGSAVYAYSVKYETILFSEQMVKTRHAIEREKDSISMLRAEWAHLVRPERLQTLADRHLDLRQLELNQIVRINDIPEKTLRVDAIGRKLEALGLAEPTATPQADRNSGAVTPAGRRQ